jgi:hypothetical protein
LVDSGVYGTIYRGKEVVSVFCVFFVPLGTNKKENVDIPTSERSLYPGICLTEYQHLSKEVGATQAQSHEKAGSTLPLILQCRSSLPRTQLEW